MRQQSSYHFRLASLALAAMLTLALAACDATSTAPSTAPLSTATGIPPMTTAETPADAQTDAQTGQTAEQPAGQGGVVGAENMLMLASALLNTNVASTIDDDLGDIADLYIDARSGNVLFATIRHGGFLGFGADHVPVPLSALQFDPVEQQLYLPISADELANFPDIDQEWAATVDPGWNNVRAYWEQAGVDVQRIQGVDESNLDSVMLASNLIYYGVGAGTSPGLARVEDFIVDLETSRIHYALLSMTDTTGAAAPAADASIVMTDPVTGAPAGGWIVIPFSAFNPGGFGTELVLVDDFDLNHLREAPNIDMAGAADAGVGVPGAAGVGATQVIAIDPAWHEEVSGYWTEAGYDVAGDEG